MSPRIIFEQELSELLEQLEEMSHIVECSYENLFEAVKIKDEQGIKLIMKNDRNINDMKRQIEAMCLKIITKQQPVAKDLRIVSSVLKVVTDIERVGDHVCDMAELIMRIHMNPFSGYSLHLDGMVTATRELFMEAVNAFVEDNPSRSQKVIEGDDVIDMLFNKVKNDIIDGLKAELKNADEYIDILMIAKYLEKIGDHAVNVAEWQIFRKTGELS